MLARLPRQMNHARLQQRHQQEVLHPGGIDPASSRRRSPPAGQQQVALALVRLVLCRSALRAPAWEAVGTGEDVGAPGPPRWRCSPALEWCCSGSRCVMGKGLTGRWSTRAPGASRFLFSLANQAGKTPACRRVSLPPALSSSAGPPSREITKPDVGEPRRPRADHGLQDHGGGRVLAGAASCGWFMSPEGEQGSP